MDDNLAPGGQVDHKLPTARASGGGAEAAGSRWPACPHRALRQLRLVVHAEDYEEALRFFRDVLGMPEQEAYAGDGGAEVTILDAGRATLEIANSAQADLIDDVEVGRRVAGHFRVALEVDDCAAASERAAAGGAVPVAPPTRTPWNSLNARFDAPGEVHLTLFQELGEQ